MKNPLEDSSGRSVLVYPPFENASALKSVSVIQGLLDFNLQ